MARSPIARRAGSWREPIGRRPALPCPGEVIRQAVVDESLAGAEAALAAVTEPKAVYEDVLPLVVAAYRRWSGESTPIAERPIMRVLDLVLHDLDFDAQEGHDLFARS